MSAGVVVLDLWQSGRAWLLGADGTATRAAGAKLAHGLGLPWPEPFSAVYADGDTLRLRVGERTWDVAAIERVRQLDDRVKRAVYELDLTDGTSERVVVRFPRHVWLGRIVDPTHDEIASWDEDVMKVLPYVAADGWTSGCDSVAGWAAAVLPKWRAGIPVPAAH